MGRPFIKTLEYRVAADAVDKDPVTGATTGGVKFDGGKLPVMSGAIEYFPLALMAVSGISLFGYQKYGAWQGWRDVPDGPRRYSDALGRHIVQKDQPDTTADTAKMADILKALGIKQPSTKLVHMAQASWNALAGLEKQVEKERDGNQ